MEDYRLSQTGQEVQDILNGAAMQVDLNTEVERATDAEGTLQSNIDVEERARQDADGLLQQGIDDEAQRAKDAEEANAGEIEGIKALIPSTASEGNKLADTNYVNSSIQTATAEYRGDYNVVTDLHLAVDATHAQIETLLPTVIAEADKNDYCYVMIPTSAQTPTEIAKIERYKMTSDGWKFEYDVNNSTFTAEEWAAIKSGITSGLVAKLNALPTNADLLLLLAGKQDVLTFDSVPVPESNNPVKSGGVYSAIDDEKTARLNSDTAIHAELDGLQAKVPATASSDNKLVDQNQMNSSISTATATYRGDWNVVSDLHLAVDATRAQIAALLPTVIATADNNDYCYVEIPTNAETPTQIERVERYKFNGTAWAFEYVLNNSGFTAAQWAAINSMITSGLVAKLSALPTNADLLSMLAQKQDNLTFDSTPTENSTNPVTSGGVFAAEKALSDAIEAILLLIPSAASALNKLVDTSLMNSSISTATATFRGTYNLVSDLGLGIDATEGQIAAALLSAISTADNNDYAFVQIPTSAETPAQIARTDRYKFNGTAWAFEYTLNTSGFTAAQWAAINSTITSALVAKLNALPTAAELQEALGTLTSGITAINQKIPSTASQANKLVDASTMESYIAQVINILDASFNVTSTDGHITLHITQVDGVITSVQVQSTDIASAADLTLLTSRVGSAEGNITSLTGRMGTAETNIANLQQLYNNLQQSKPVPVTALPSTGQQQGVIYRLAGTTSYSDYMWNGSSWVLMATYNNAIDPRPKKASQNLVTSGGVFDNMGALDVSELNATENPHTLTKYADLSAALAAIPTDYQKGGMSIKFVQSSDNKYVQFRCMAQSFTTNVADWQGVDDDPTAGSDNLAKSGGITKFYGANINSEDGAILKIRHQVDITTESQTGNRYAIIFGVSKGDSLYVQSSYAAGIIAAVYDTIDKAIYLGDNYTQIFGNYSYSHELCSGYINQDGYLSITFKKEDNSPITDAEISNFLSTLSISLVGGLFSSVINIKKGVSEKVVYTNENINFVKGSWISNKANTKPILYDTPARIRTSEYIRMSKGDTFVVDVNAGELAYYNYFTLNDLFKISTDNLITSNVVYVVPQDCYLLFTFGKVDASNYSAYAPLSSISISKKLLGVSEPDDDTKTLAFVWNITYPIYNNSYYKKFISCLKKGAEYKISLINSTNDLINNSYIGLAFFDENFNVIYDTGEDLLKNPEKAGKFTVPSNNRRCYLYIKPLAEIDLVGKSIQFLIEEQNADIISNINALYIGDVAQQAHNATGLVDEENLKRVSMKDALAIPYIGCSVKFHLPADVMVGIRHGSRGAYLLTNSYWYKDEQVFTFPDTSIYYRISFGNGLRGEDSNISLEYIKECIKDGKIQIEIIQDNNGSVVSRNSSQEKILKACMLNETNYRIGNLLNTYPIIVHATDVHGDYYRMRNIYEYAYSIKADAIVVTGDICSYQPSDGQNYLESLDDEFNIPTIVCTGNHDTSYITTQDGLYNQVVKHFAEKYAPGQTTPYYYQDVSSIGIRFISINIYDGGHTSTQEYCNIFRTQMEWFISTLASTPANYGVIVLMHSPEEEIVAAGSDTSFISPLVEYPHYHDGMTGTPLKDIIEAFRNKTAGSTTYKNYSEESAITVSFDFSQVDSSVYFIAFVSGHQHEDLCGFNIGTTQPHLNNTCSIAAYGMTDYPYYSNLSDLPRGTNGVTQDCFNVYVIDKSNRDIKVIKIGSTLKTDLTERSHTIIPY